MVNPGRKTEKTDKNCGTTEQKSMGCVHAKRPARTLNLSYVLSPFRAPFVQQARLTSLVERAPDTHTYYLTIHSSTRNPDLFFRSCFLSTWYARIDPPADLRLGRAYQGSCETLAPTLDPISGDVEVPGITKKCNSKRERSPVCKETFC